MNKFVAILVTLFVALASAASRSAQRRHFTYAGPDKVDDWTPLGRAEPTVRVGLIVHLVQRNIDQLKAFVADVSNPRSANYAQNYLTIDDLTDLIAPPQANVDLVLGWLSHEDVTVRQVTPNRDMIDVSMPVGLAEKIFETTLFAFRHVDAPITVVRCMDDYSVPKEIGDVINVVTGMYGLPKLNFAKSSSDTTSTYYGYDVVTPAFLSQAYNVSDDMVGQLDYSENRQAVVEFTGQFFSHEDLQTFFHRFSPVNVGTKVWRIVGADPQHGYIGLESSLDIEYIMSTGPHVPTVFYSFENAFDYFETSVYAALDIGLFKWAANVSADDLAPWVHSISYGEYGGDYEGMQRVALGNEVLKMASRGISVLMASGDNGVGCSYDGSTFEEDFPDEPMMTMVGATQWFTGEQESGATLSSGGFSSFWNRDNDAPWQSDVVEQYLSTNTNLPPSSMYNSTGRAYPDIAAAGMMVTIVQDGAPTLVEGTSCAAPIVAGYLSIINDMRLRAGKNTIGFANPALYAAPANAYNSITEGNNHYYECEGFEAQAGWDPVTGLGSPNVGNLAAYFLSLP